MASDRTSPEGEKAGLEAGEHERETTYDRKGRREPRARRQRVFGSMIIVEEKRLSGLPKSVKTKAHHEGEDGEGGKESQADRGGIAREGPVLEFGVVSNTIVMRREGNARHVHQRDGTGTKTEDFLQGRMRGFNGAVHRVDERVKSSTQLVRPVQLPFHHKGRRVQNAKHPDNRGVLKSRQILHQA